MNVGIRLRLTVLYFSFFALAAALLSLSSWVLLKHSLDALLLHELEERVDDLEQFLSTQAPNCTLDSSVLTGVRGSSHSKTTSRFTMSVSRSSA